MKMRSLPQSFWQQPNVENPLSPGAVFSTLPPLPGQVCPTPRHLYCISDTFFRNKISHIYENNLFRLNQFGPHNY